MSEPVKIVYDTLKGQVEQGLKLEQLKDFYGLNISQMKNVLKQTGLKIRKTRKNPAFIIEGFTIETESPSKNEEPEIQDETDLEDEMPQVEQSPEEDLPTTSPTDKEELQVKEELFNLEPVSATEKKNLWD